MKLAYLALLGSVLCASTSAQCDFVLWNSKLSQELRTLRLSKSPFETTYLQGHCTYLQSLVVPTNATVIPTELVQEAYKCGETTYATVLSEGLRKEGESPTAAEEQVACNQLFTSTGLGTVFAGDSITVCQAPLLYQFKLLCVPPPECPQESERHLLTPLNDCTLDSPEAIGSKERDEYVNSNQDALCVQSSSNNPCDPNSEKSARKFDDCKMSTAFVVALLKGSAAACVEGFAPKEDRCTQDIGTVIQEMCAYSEDSMIPLIAGAAGGGVFVLILVAALFLRRGKSNNNNTPPYGKQENFGSYNNGSNNKMAGSSFTSPPMVGAYPSSSAGMMQPQSIHASFAGSSPYGSGMPGSSPYGSQMGGGGPRAPGASGGAMVPSGKYLGVMRNNATGVWVAEFRDNGVNEYLGQFDTEDEAARAYDIRALQVKGSAVELNFPFGSAGGPGSGLGLAGLKVGGMPPPMPGRGMGSTAGSVAGGSVAGGPTTASLKEQLTQFYNFHDPGRPNISGHVDRLFEKYRFVNIARAVKAKYQRLPPGWEEELSRRGESADPSGSASTLTRPPGL